MIIGESIVKVPCKKYTISINCRKTRRLTAIEWILLSCVNKFSDDSEMGANYIKCAFEDVLHMTSSEFLIKPCVKNLSSLGVIKIDELLEFNYSNIRFNQIHITERGVNMLNEGLIPGESYRKSIAVYYNPFIGQMFTYEPKMQALEQAIQIGEAEEVDEHFPKEEIIQFLQNGDASNQRFAASQYKVDEVELMNEEEWEHQFELSIGISGEENIIYTEPLLRNRGISRKIKSILMVKGLSESYLDQFQSSLEIEMKNIVGSGSRLKKAFIEVCKNARTIGIDIDAYKIVKANTSVFRNKTVIFWGEESFDVIKGDFLEIHLPFSFVCKDCVVINEKKEHLFIAKGKYQYDEINIMFPIAYQDDKSISGETALNYWLENKILELYKKDVSYLALLTLDMFKYKKQVLINKLKGRWNEQNIEEVIKDLVKLGTLVSTMETKIFPILELKNFILDKIDFKEFESAQKEIQKLMSLSILNGKEVKTIFAKDILLRFHKPKDYVEMLQMYQMVGITSHDAALEYDEEISNIYSEQIIEGIIKAIMENNYQKLPEFFAYDVFFNDYYNCLQMVSSALNHYDLFQCNNIKQLIDSIAATSDLSYLKSYMEQIRAKEAYLESQNMSILYIMQGINNEAALNYRNNCDIIEAQIAEKYSNSNKEQTRNIFIIDTCALIHQPNLLEYFNENDYIRIPTKVIEEIGKIKDGRSKKYSNTLSTVARNISKDLERFLSTMNQNSPFRFMIENADVTLLPLDLDATVPDNQILSVALKYAGESPTIISDDGVFRLTSISQNIGTISSMDFVKSKQK